MVFLIIVLVTISVLMTILPRRTGCLHEAFQVDETDVKQLKNDLARVALAVRIHNNAHTPDDIARIKRDVTESAVEVARAHVTNETELLRDGLRVVREQADQYASKLTSMQDQVATISRSIISEADRLALLSSMEEAKQEIHRLDLAHVSDSSKLQMINDQITQLQAALDTVRSSTTSTLDQVNKMDASYRAQLQAVVDKMQTSQASTTEQVNKMGASYHDQLIAVTSSVSSLRSNDIKALHDELGALKTSINAVQTTTGQLQHIRSAFDANATNLMLGSEDAYLSFDTARAIMHRPSDKHISIGQSASRAGDGFVEDVRIMGNGSRFHALAFGGTMSDPATSTVISERQLDTGDSELLLAKYGQGRGSAIRQHAAEHVFTVPKVVGDPVPIGVADALNASDKHDEVMRISSKGLEIGDHVLRSGGKELGMLVCDKAGELCSPLVTVATQARQNW